MHAVKAHAHIFSSAFCLMQISVGNIVDSTSVGHVHALFASSAIDVKSQTKTLTLQQLFQVHFEQNEASKLLSSVLLLSKMSQ